LPNALAKGKASKTHHAILGIEIYFDILIDAKRTIVSSTINFGSRIEPISWNAGVI